MDLYDDPSCGWQNSLLVSADVQLAKRIILDDLEEGMLF